MRDLEQANKQHASMVSTSVSALSPVLDLPFSPPQIADCNLQAKINPFLACGKLTRTTGKCEQQAQAGAEACPSLRRKARRPRSEPETIAALSLL